MPSLPDPSMAALVLDLFNSFSAGWISGDVDTFAAHWTEDAIFWPPSGEELRGREAISAWTVELGATADLEVAVLHAEALGGDIFVVGNFGQDVSLQGASVHFRGGFTGVLRDIGEGLQVHRLISFPERAVPR